MTHEKRRARRFELSLPVTLLSNNEKKGPVPLHSKDISSTGILLEFDESMQPGTKVEFDITLPSEITQGSPVRLHCLGYVVRVDRGENRRTGVAVSIERYEFTRSREDAPRPLRMQ